MTQVHDKPLTAADRQDTAEHPAVRAWRGFQPSVPLAPSSIEMLEKGKKTNVYRLNGFADNSQTLIAKRCRRRTSVVERTVYEQFLTRLPLPTLGYHGFAADEDDEYGWLFLEDAGPQRYSPEDEQHRQLAGQWLAVLHVATLAAPGRECLPVRQPSHYLEELQASENVIRENLGNPALTADDVALLQLLLSSYHFLQSRWDYVEGLCHRLPQTLVHGDLAAKNLRIRGQNGDPVLLAFDWETAGWGTPAVDFAPSVLDSVSPSLTSYLAVAREQWPHLTIDDLRQLAQVGVIFRLIYSIAWEQAGLIHARWASRGLAEKCAKWTMVELRNYHARLANAVAQIDWEHERR